MNNKIDELKKLKTLHSDGILTQSEFETLKEQIITGQDTVSTSNKSENNIEANQRTFSQYAIKNFSKFGKIVDEDAQFVWIERSNGKMLKATKKGSASSNIDSAEKQQTRPQEVVSAAVLLYISLAIGGFNLFALRVNYFLSDTVVYIGVGVLVIYFLFITAILNGKSWARNTYLVLSIISIILFTVGWMYSLAMEIEIQFDSLSIVQILLTVIPTALLMGKASKKWFSK